MTEWSASAAAPAARQSSQPCPAPKNSSAISGNATCRRLISSTNSHENGCSRPASATGGGRSDGVVAIASEQAIAQRQRGFARQPLDLQLADLGAGGEDLQRCDAEVARDRTFVDVGVLDARTRNEGFRLPEHAALEQQAVGQQDAAERPQIR